MGRINIRLNLIFVIFSILILSKSEMCFGASSWDTYPITSTEASKLQIVWYSIDSSTCGIGQSSTATSAPYNHTSYSGVMHIPSSIDGKKVVEIGPYAFYKATGMTKITIPNSVTSIGSRAFEGCTGLTYLHLGNNITTINSYAFRSCSNLTSIYLPSSCNSIGDFSFAACTKLSLLYLSSGVTTIGRRIVQGDSNLKSIIIPKSVTSINTQALYSSGITSLYICGASGSISGAPFGASSATITYNYVDSGVNEPYVNEYTFSVPSVIEIGKDSTYSISGRWSEYLRMSITLEDNVDITCDLDGEVRNIDVNFNEISIFGEGSSVINKSGTIFLSEPDGILFGTWKGTITFSIAAIG